MQAGFLDIKIHAGFCLDSLLHSVLDDCYPVTGVYIRVHILEAIMDQKRFLPCHNVLQTSIISLIPTNKLFEGFNKAYFESQVHRL